MREKRIKPDLPEDFGGAGTGAKPARRSFVAQLLGGLFEWRRREADRTIQRYGFLMAQPTDRLLLSEDEAARPAPSSGIDRLDAPLTVSVVDDLHLADVAAAGAAYAWRRG